jgi:hypothetical protein
MRLILALLSSMFLSVGALTAEDAKASEGSAGYPLTKGVVSDEVLGEMGKPVRIAHEGTDVYLCCKSCIKDFKKEPEKHVEKVRKAPKKQGRLLESSGSTAPLMTDGAGPAGEISPPATTLTSIREGLTLLQLV